MEACDIYCRIAECPRAVRQGGWPGSASEDRWYITMGHPGFNSPANNRGGYKTQASAWRAIRRYSAPDRKARR